MLEQTQRGLQRKRVSLNLVYSANLPCGPIQLAFIWINFNIII